MIVILLALAIEIVSSWQYIIEFAVFAVTPSTLLLNVPSKDNTPKNTTITAEVKNKELLYNKTVEIVNVNVKDNESKALTNLNETRFSVSDLNGEVPLKFTNNNSIITLNNLNAGPHSLKINFLGNASYNPSETIVNLTIFTNTITTKVSTIR